MIDNKQIDAKHIDVLDGIRAISVIIVLIFHFWQQTWIFPTIKTPFLQSIGITQINFTHWAKAGYLFVDMMVLISGFLLCLPLARHVLMNENMFSIKQYARKRIARILPSYLFCVISLFIYKVATGGYTEVGDAILDLITHLTFTQTLFLKTYISTQLNVVLWTLAIEVWFYLLFPFLAMFIKRKNDNDAERSIVKLIIVAVVMIIAFYVFKDYVVLSGDKYLPMWINQFPSFLSTYAIGMLGAFIYILFAKNMQRSPALEYFSLILSVVGIIIINSMLQSCSDSSNVQYWQITNRTYLCVVFMIFILSTAFAPKWYRSIFSNKFMKFLSGISFNLYIWHQLLAVMLKYDWHIPYWTGDVPPNQTFDRVWMWKYAIIITVVAFAAATLVTYLIEKPFANIILGKKKQPAKRSAEN